MIISQRSFKNYISQFLILFEIGVDHMTFKLKDPGSAITHFIGMIMALLATIPLLVKAAREPDW